MKIAIIGGGSTYTPEIVSGLLHRKSELPVSELWLMDISQKRLDIVGRFAQRMVKADGSPFDVYLTTDQKDAIRDADYIVTQVRVGGMEARRADEYLGQRYQLVGQETTGIGGMSKALRTIPIILQVAHDMEELAPHGLLLNFTNPAGLVTEALSRYSNIQAIGVCNGPFSIQKMLMKLLYHKRPELITSEDVQMNVLGINHLSWQYGMTIDGEDLWDEVMAAYLDYVREGHTPFDVNTIEVLQMIPSSYLQYYYATDKKIQEQAKWPPSRAEQVMSIEADLLDKYRQPYLTQAPKELMQRGGAYYSTVATQMINAHYNDLNEIHATNVCHAGAVNGVPSDWVMEMNCRVNRNGVHPIETPSLPPVCQGLVSSVKAYELLTAEAAVTGNYDLAYQAILAHPLRPASDQIETVLNDMLSAHRDHLPKFHKQGAVT